MDIFELRKLIVMYGDLRASAAIQTDEDYKDIYYQKATVTFFEIDNKLLEIFKKEVS